MKGEWTIGEIGAGVGILATAAIGVAFAVNLNAKVERLEERLQHQEITSANDLCLAVVQRQVEAIEKGREEVTDRLSKLADEHGCVREFVEVSAMWREATPEEERAARERTLKDREALERNLAEIDRVLLLPSVETDR